MLNCSDYQMIIIIEECINTLSNTELKYTKSEIFLSVNEKEGKCFIEN